MSSQAFLSTPTFELFRRGQGITVIQRFHGLNAFVPITALPPDWASDLLNVVISGNGELSKLRLPIALLPDGPLNTGLQGFWDFQQGNGLRQVLVVSGQNIFFYTPGSGPGVGWSNKALADNTPGDNPPWSFIVANNILFGSNGQRLKKWTGKQFWNWGHAIPVQGPAAPTTGAGNLSPTQGGYIYGFAWKNSVTGHCGNMSAVSPATGNVVNQQFTVSVPAADLNNGNPPDSQFDTIVWFRSLDGGGAGDCFRLAEVTIASMQVTFNAATVTVSNGGYTITDNTPDTNLDLTIRGPLINNPPLQGKFVALGQGRVFIGNLNGNNLQAPQDIIYSGYEKILFGRPEESFPPSNRLRLSIGAESLGGMGVIQAGLVAFSQTGRMYMLRGAIQDIVTTQPTNFTSFLQELPWTLGCLSHYTIQATPYGLVWLAGDKTVQLFDGRSEPNDLSVNIYPILRQITPGSESICVSSYFNWLERDWYALCCPVNGSLVNNRILFFALNPDKQSIEIFVSDIQADWIGTITLPTNQRILAIAQNGQLYQLPISADTLSGITQDLTLIPQQPTQNLHAYWRSGGFGNDSPHRSRMFRWARIVTDQDAASFQMQARLVDDDIRLITMPEIQSLKHFRSGRFPINRRAKRCFVEIDFPQQDVSANLLELHLSRIDTSER